MLALVLVLPLGLAVATPVVANGESEVSIKVKGEVIIDEDGVLDGTVCKATLVADTVSNKFLYVMKFDKKIFIPDFLGSGEGQWVKGWYGEGDLVGLVPDGSTVTLSIGEAQTYAIPSGDHWGDEDPAVVIGTITGNKVSFDLGVGVLTGKIKIK